MSRIFLVLIVLALAALALGHRSSAAAGPVATPPPAPVHPANAQPTTARHPVESPTLPGPPASAPAPATPAATTTPTIDRMVRLESRRRLIQAAEAAYVDSLVPTDSIIRRWGDREGRPIAVAMVPPARPNAARLVALTWEAVREWERVGLGVQFAEASDTAAAEIVIHWIDQFPMDRTGQTDTQMTGAGVIVAARITLALKDHSGRALDEPALRAIGIHELGHALGLPHSGSRSDIMFPVTMVNRPSGRDRATAVLLYSLPPGPLREPSS